MGIANAAYFHSEAEITREFNATVAVTYGIFAILCYDWVMSFRRFDLQLLTGKMTWKVPYALYFANRASAAIFIVLTIIANAAALGQTGAMNDISCDRMVQAILAFAVIQATLSSFVLAFRCMALYQLKWTVVGLLTLMMCLQFAFAIPVITTVPWTPGYPKGASGCNNALTISDDSHLWCAINYAWTAVVDVTVLLLSLHRLLGSSAGHHSEREFNSSIAKWTVDYWARLHSARQYLSGDGNKSMVHFLIDQGLGAVLLTLLFNMPVMILEFIHLNSQAVFIIYNIGVVANSIISCHIIMTLNEQNRNGSSRKPTSNSGGPIIHTNDKTPYSTPYSSRKQPTQDTEDSRHLSQIELVPQLKSKGESTFYKP